MVILQHDQSLSSISGFGGPLQLWYVKKAEQTPSNVQGQSENIPPTINVIRQPIGLTNLGTTCYLNALIQMAYSFYSNSKKYYKVLDMVRERIGKSDE